MAKTAVLNELGVGSIRIEEREPEPLGEHSVRVRIRAASLNYRDLLIAHGHYGAGITLPLIPGSDGAGDVIETGSEVNSVRPGDRVCTHMTPDWMSGPLRPEFRLGTLGGPADGVFAEERVLPETALLKIPDALSYEQAACLPVAGLTAWSAIKQAGLAAATGRLLVLGTGGVSMMGLVIGKAIGLEVAVTSGSQGKLELARSLGADLTLSRLEPGWPAAVRRWSEGGVDLVLEVGGDGTFDQSLQATRDDGCIALIGVLARKQRAVRLDEVLMRRVRVNGTFTGPRDELEELVQLTAERGLECPIGVHLESIERIRLAYARLQQARHAGKCVLTLS